MPKVGRPNSLKNKEFKSKETLPSDSDTDTDMKPREKVKVYNSSDSETENKSTAKVKLISSIFATKNKKARELSDSGSEKEDNPSRATKMKGPSGNRQNPNG